MEKLERQGALKPHIGRYTRATCSLDHGAMVYFNDSAGRLKIYAKLLLTGKHKGSLGQKAHRMSP